MGRARAQNEGDDAHRETGNERELCKAAHRQTVDLSAISLFVLSQKRHKGAHNRIGFIVLCVLCARVSAAAGGRMGAALDGGVSEQL